MRSILAISLLILMQSCHRKAVVKAPVGSASSDAIAKPSAKVIIYKTNKDYSQQLPVGMNAARTEVQSYPSVSDIILGDSLRLPIGLGQGYWLDHQGIGPDHVFSHIRYDEYKSGLVSVRFKEILERLEDKHPITEMYECGDRNQYDQMIKSMQNLVREGALKSKCRQIYP